MLADMASQWKTVQRFAERLVFEEVSHRSEKYPDFTHDMLADVACVALNRLQPRYIRHAVDFSF